VRAAQHQALARLHAPHPHEEEHKRKRHLRGTIEVDHSNKRQVLAMLPYSK